MPLKTADVLKKGKYGFYNNIAHPINSVYSPPEDSPPEGSPPEGFETLPKNNPKNSAASTAQKIKNPKPSSPDIFAPIKAALLDFLDWPDMGNAGGSTADAFKKALSFVALFAKKTVALFTAILGLFMSTSHPNALDKLVDWVAGLIEQLDPDNKKNKEADRATIEFVAYFICITPLVYFITHNWFYHYLFEYAKQTEGVSGVARFTKLFSAIINNFPPLVSLKRVWNIFFPQGESRKRSGGEVKQDISYPINNLNAAFSSWKMNNPFFAFFLHLVFYPAVFIDGLLKGFCRILESVVGTAFSAVFLFIAIYYIFHYWSKLYSGKALDVIEYIAIIFGWFSWIGDFILSNITFLTTSPLIGLIMVIIASCINLAIGIQLKPYAHMVVFFYFFVVSFFTIAISEGFSQVWMTMRIMYDFYSGVYGDGESWNQKMQSAVWKNFGFIGMAFVLMVFLLGSIESKTSTHMLFMYIVVLAGFGLLILAIATNMWSGWWDRLMDGETIERDKGGPPTRRQEFASGTGNLMGDLLKDPVGALKKARELATNPLAAVDLVKGKAGEIAKKMGDKVGELAKSVGDNPLAAVNLARNNAGDLLDKVSKINPAEIAKTGELASAAVGLPPNVLSGLVGKPADATAAKAGETTTEPTATKAGEITTEPAAAPVAETKPTEVLGKSTSGGEGGEPIFNPFRKFRSRSWSQSDDMRLRT